MQLMGKHTEGPCAVTVLCVARRGEAERMLARANTCRETSVFANVE